jgi:hypothetical protein
LLKRHHQAAVEHGHRHYAEHRRGRHQHLRLLRHSAQRAYAHAADADEVEEHVIAEAVGHFVVERHAGEGGEGEE